MTETFQKMKAESKKLGEHRDCAVVATAVAAGIGYREAHALLAKFGRRARKGTSPMIYHAALKSLGLTVERIDKTHPLSKCRTVVTLGRSLPSRGVFLVSTASHVLACRAGQVHDWTKNRRHRILAIHRVSRPAEATAPPELPATPIPSTLPIPRPRRRRRSTPNHLTLIQLFRLRENQ